MMTIHRTTLERVSPPAEPRGIRLRGPHRVARLVMAALAAILVVASSAAAQVLPERAQKTADAAIGRLRSPFCPGLMLEVCPSPDAEALRDSIRGMAAEGQSAKQIVEGVLARHGEEWRAVPKRSGAGLFAWLALPFVLVVGGIFVWSRVKAMRGQGQVYAVAAGQGMTEDERVRLEQALREFERVEDKA